MTVENPGADVFDAKKIEQAIQNPDASTLEILDNERREKYIRGESWESLIVAGEEAELGVDVKSKLTEAERRTMIGELNNIRQKLRGGDDYEAVLDLARCMYRLKKIGLTFEPPNPHERKLMEQLPKLFRTDPEWPKNHLAYIPQIAAALEIDPNELKHEDDDVLVIEALKTDLQKGGAEELDAMAIGVVGLLANFDSDAARRIMQSEEWHEERWIELLSHIETLKKTNDGWKLARVLPPLQKLIRLRNMT